jgi:hypothetical protein
MTKKIRKAKEVTLAAQQRIVETAALLLNLKSRRYIIDTLVDKYGIQPRTVDAIITHAYEYIKDNYRVDRESVVAKHIEFYYDTVDKWRDIDPKACLKAMEQVEKLLRLHDTSPLIQNNTLNMSLENVTNEQLIKAIDSMKEDKKE